MFFSIIRNIKNRVEAFGASFELNKSDLCASIKLRIFVCIIFLLSLLSLTVFKIKKQKINTLEKEINGEVVKLSRRGSPRLQESGG